MAGGAARRARQHSCSTRVFVGQSRRSDGRAGAGLRHSYLLVGSQRAARGGARWLSALLAATRSAPVSAARARALTVQGILTRVLLDFPAAKALHEQSLAIAQALGVPDLIATALANVSLVEREMGNYAEAKALLERCLIIRRELGERAKLAVTLNNLAVIYRDLEHFAVAQTLHEESLGIRRGLGAPSAIANSLLNLAELAHDRGDLVAIQGLCIESIAICKRVGDHRRMPTRWRYWASRLRAGQR